MASSDDREHLHRLFRAIHAVVRTIPRGRVATYGQVAELAGIPNGGRIGGAAMKQHARVPWQRVIGKASKTRGRIAIHDPVGAALQRELLEREGVEVGDRGLVDLTTYGWLTVSRARAASPRRRPRSASTRRASSSRR
jgi:methylated-DNA-protein-cysteine methyltransferase-like protein